MNYYAWILFVEIDLSRFVDEIGVFDRFFKLIFQFLNRKIKIAFEWWQNGGLYSLFTVLRMSFHLCLYVYAYIYLYVYLWDIWMALILFCFLFLKYSILYLLYTTHALHGICSDENFCLLCTFNNILILHCLGVS